MKLYSVERTEEREAVEDFIFHPDLWERSKEDDTKKIISDEVLGLEQFNFLLVRCRNENVGLMVCHEGLSHTVEIHIKVKPEHRKRHSFMVGFLSLQWLMKNTKYNKVITWVPEIYPEIRAFCKKRFGFVEEGFNRQSFMKNGVMTGMYLYGLTRDEIEGILCQRYQQ